MLTDESKVELMFLLIEGVSTTKDDDEVPQEKKLQTATLRKYFDDE